MLKKNSMSHTNLCVPDVVDNDLGEWDLSVLFVDQQDWEQQFEEAKELVQKDPCCCFKNKLFESVDIFCEFVEQTEALARKLDKLYLYSMLRHQKSLSSDEADIMCKKAEWLQAQYMEMITWVLPEVMAATTQEIERITQSSKTSLYGKWITDIQRLRFHRASYLEESFITKLSVIMNFPSSYHTILSNLETEFGSLLVNNQEKTLTKSNYSGFIRDQNREVREKAFLLMNQGLMKHQHSYKEIINHQMQNLCFISDIRKYTAPLSAKMYEQQVPDILYFNVINTAKQYVGLLSKCVKYRQQLLSYEKIYPWDIYAPVYSDDNLELFTYKEAIQLSLDVVAELGEDYLNVAYMGLTSQKWVDAYSAFGKTSGAFSSGCYGSFPYILMNFQGGVSDVYTLIHELGHSMHSYYSNKAQPYTYHSYNLLIAEVVSNVNEELLRRKWLASTNIKYVNLAKLMYTEETISAFFRQALFAEFEYWLSDEVSSGNCLATQKINNKFDELQQLYFSGTVEYHELSKYSWMGVPHFYLWFYVYQYSVGFCASISIVNRLQSGLLSVEQYLDFLKAGNSKTPKRLLQELGIDITSSLFIKESLEYINKAIR